MPYPRPLQQASHQMHDLATVGYPEVPMVGAYINTASTDGLLPHNHPGVLEICYLVSGQQIYQVAGQDYQMRGNDVFVTFPGEVHSTGSSPQSKGLLYWLQVELPRRPARFLGQAADQAWPLVERLRGLPLRHFRGVPRLKSMFEEILNQARAEDPLERLQLGIRVLDWLLLVARCAGRAAADATAPGSGLPPNLSRDLRKLCEALAREPEAAWSIERMATVTRLSPSRFKAKFKEQLGLPPREYLLRLRIEAARQRLRMGNVSITELAYELGFSSSQYFATVFKRYTLRTPRDERQQATPPAE